MTTTTAPQPLRGIMQREIERLDALSPEARREEALRYRQEQDAAIRLNRPRKETRWPQIPERFRDVELDEYEAETDSERLALQAAGKFAQLAAAGRGPMLALVGTTGVGKSHLLWGVAHRLVQQALPYYGRPWYLLADELRYGGPHPLGAGAAVEEPQVCRDVLWNSRRVVLIDEADHTSGTDFDRIELKKFLHHAWDRRMAVMLTSPVNPLADLVGPQAASRFSEIVVQGRDRRKT
jgi:hypothetical protein